MDPSRGKSLDVGQHGLDAAGLPPYEDGPIQLGQLFDRPELPVEMEIGSGKGTFLVQQGVAQPQTNFLGIEWTSEYWRYAADRLRRHSLGNVRVLRADATEFIRYWVGDASVGVIHLYFSDPWPKSRHHKRRVVQDSTLIQFHRILRAGGELRLVTDHLELWSWYEAHASRAAGLFSVREFEGTSSAREGELVGSNFERKFALEGRPFRAMTLVKR